ncbi:MAG: iron-sulfur cluster carrier protein ApbC [Kangiellaceae bacterium]|nr:iron-sulfur cluster carrier protein ApbC [Kangiellaceae bacterium]
MLEQQTLLELIRTSTFSHFPENLNLADFIKQSDIKDNTVELLIQVPFPFDGKVVELTAELGQVLKTAWADQGFVIKIQQNLVAYETKAGVAPIGKVKNIIAVASGKGGVGKSTTSVNLALALQKEGAKVGILDADIYGPSIPIMLGIPEAKPESKDKKTIEPLSAHGLKTMSIGFLVDEKQAMVWRGPMASSALQQIVRDTQWGELDFLVIDLPPGTGDIQLTMAQKIPVTAAVIVTTPQDLALADAKKAIAMFEKVSIPVMGVVENMATHICSECGHQEAIFGEGGGSSLAADYAIDLLGQLPLTMSIREDLDNGVPTVAKEPNGQIAENYRDIARKLTANLTVLGKDFSKGAKAIDISTWKPNS